MRILKQQLLQNISIYSVRGYYDLRLESSYVWDYGGGSMTLSSGHFMV